MKFIKFVTPLKEEEIDNLKWFEYTIIYHDEKDNLLKVATPDYDNQIIDDTFLDSALLSSNIYFFKNVRLNDLVNETSPLMLTISDGVVESIYCNGFKQNCVSSLSYSGKILAKRLK